MIKQCSIDYAEHNEKVCKYLNRKPEFADWVITTAFYSGLQYLRSRIFPMQIVENGKKMIVTDFNNYCLINGSTKANMLTTFGQRGYMAYEKLIEYCDGDSDIDSDEE